MGGRKWHWIAAGVAALAVASAVLANDTRPRGELQAHTFPTVSYEPQYGRAVTAQPTVDATTVSKTTTPPPPPPRKTSSSPAPPPPPPPTSQTPDFSITLTVPDLPVYYPSCTYARLAGAAPIYKGQPGYRDELDRNRNGIACER
jgi:hypothetical protein